MGRRAVEPKPGKLCPSCHRLDGRGVSGWPPKPEAPNYVAGASAAHAVGGMACGAQGGVNGKGLWCTWMSCGAQIVHKDGLRSTGCGAQGWLMVHRL